MARTCRIGYKLSGRYLANQNLPANLLLFRPKENGGLSRRGRKLKTARGGLVNLIDRNDGTALFWRERDRPPGNTGWSD